MTEPVEGKPEVAAQRDVPRAHTFDGIQEYDNPLPLWWLATVIGSILFGYGYWFYFQIGRIGLTGAEAYAAEQRQEAADKAAAMASAAPKPGAHRAGSDTDILEASKDGDVLEAGQRVFASTCVVCHGKDGEGKIGPNLTDAYWLHGGRPSEIYQTISRGVLDKGMAAWLDNLGAEKTRAVAAYVVSRRGLNLPGKPPQGEKLTAEQLNPKPEETAPAAGATVAAAEPAAPPPPGNSSKLFDPLAPWAPLAVPPPFFPPQPDNLLVKEAKDKQLVANGDKLFHANCAVCHGQQGQGLVGPNLTDSYWLHGGKPSQIYASVAGGYSAKGMPSWYPLLGAEDTRAVAAYVISRRALNLPGKAPQGDVYAASK